MLDERRPMRAYVDSKEIAVDKRIRVQGRANMTLLPDFFTIDFYNLTDDDIGALRSGKTVYITAIEGSTICYGQIEDIYSHEAGSNDITTIGISDGWDFWNAKVNMTIGSGAGIRETINSIINGAVFGSYLADNPRLIRGQSIYGSLPDAVQNMASAVNARAFIAHGALHIVGKGKYDNMVIIRDEDIIMEPDNAHGVCIVQVKVKGYSVGTMVTMMGGVYRLVAQAVDADNFMGTWKTELILANEDMVENMGGW